MSAGGLDPYDDDDEMRIFIRLLLTRAQVTSLDRMAKAAGATRSDVVQAIMRDVIADEMADRGAEKVA